MPGERTNSPVSATLYSSHKLYLPTDLCFLRFHSRPRYRETQRRLRHLARAILPEPNDVDRAGIIRAARIVGVDPLVAHPRRAIPVSQGDIVGAGRAKLFPADQPGAKKAVRLVRFFDVVAVCGSELPARRTRTRPSQRRHVRVVQMRPAPDLKS